MWKNLIFSGLVFETQHDRQMQLRHSRLWHFKCRGGKFIQVSATTSIILSHKYFRYGQFNKASHDLMIIL